MVVVDDVSMAKMSGGDVVFEPYLDSRKKKDTVPQLKFSKPSATKSVGVGSG